LLLPSAECHVSPFDNQSQLAMLTLIAIFALVALLPVKWAADFTDGGNTGFPFCAIASLVAPMLAVLAFRVSSGGFNGFMFAYLALLATYVFVLRIPARAIIGFAVLALALQGAAVMALLSFGVNVGKLLSGHS